MKPVSTILCLLSGGVLCAVLLVGACAQSTYEVTSDHGVASLPVTCSSAANSQACDELPNEPIPVDIEAPIKRPAVTMESPGAGSPRGPVRTDVTIFSVQGNWFLSTEEGVLRVAIELSGKPGEAVGTAKFVEDWPFALEPPTRWIYLAMGQLILTDDAGAIVWTGQVENEQLVRGTLRGQSKASQFSRSD